MVTSSDNVHPIQNMGLVDRALRFAGGALILGAIVLYFEMEHAWFPLTVMVYATAISIYPLLTGLIGWDPFYALFKIRSCNDSGRNQCGTFPYQVKAMTGHAPRYCDDGEERSLEACHDEPGERPHHALWRVEQEPMLYPDDRTLDEYVRKHPPDATSTKRGAADKAA